MDDLILYEYAISGRYSELCNYYESHPELLEKDENQELLEAAKYRKLFYECDRAISTISIESDLEEVNNLINSLSEKWNINHIPASKIQDFWDDYEYLIIIVSSLRNSGENETKLLLQKLWPDEEQYEIVTQHYNEYKERNISESESKDELRKIKMSLSKVICEIEDNSCGTSILQNYLHELEKGINESEISLLDKVLEDDKKEEEEKKEEEKEIRKLERSDKKIKERNLLFDTAQKDMLIESKNDDEDSDASSSSSSSLIDNSILQRISQMTIKHRIRREWTEEELKGLKKGVKRFGEGKWKDIQKKYLPNRTNVMIKDKVRSMKNSKNIEDVKRIYTWIDYYKKHYKNKY